MAGIRQRRRHLIKAGAAGAVLAGTPLVIGILVLFYGNLAARQQIKEYQEFEEGLSTYQVCMLNSEKLRGEVITKQDIHVVEVLGKNVVNNFTGIKDIAGKTVKYSLPEGTVLSGSLVSEWEMPQNDIRSVEYRFINLPEAVQENDYIDVRIFFPNGEDYIVAANKKVIGLAEKGQNGSSYVELQVNESEMLRLASARTDIEQYEGSTVYAVSYVDDGQNMAMDTYPVNPYVYSLGQWDPNVVAEFTTIANEYYRGILEANLQSFFNQDAPDR